MEAQRRKMTPKLGTASRQRHKSRQTLRRAMRPKHSTVLYASTLEITLTPPLRAMGSMSMPPPLVRHGSSDVDVADLWFSRPCQHQLVWCRHPHRDRASFLHLQIKRKLLHASCLRHPVCTAAFLVAQQLTVCRRHAGNPTPCVCWKLLFPIVMC